MGVYWKIQILGRGLTKNQYIGRNCLKSGAWIVCKFKGSLGKRRWGGAFEGGFFNVFDLTINI